MDFRILHEDNQIIVVEKPVNVPVQRDSSENDDLFSAVKEYIREKYNKEGNVYLGLVHRLDRPVGGVMVFARTSKAAERLSAAIREREMLKVYYAALRGVPKKNKDTLKHYLLKDEKTNTVSSVPMSTAGAREAILEYEVIETAQNLALARVILHTGRAHQIRVQLASVGCPLWGDQKYGAAVNKPGQQLALWACQLTLTHPVSKELMTFYDPPPADKAPWKAFVTDLDNMWILR